jgi:hypothetical protein
MEAETTADQPAVAVLIVEAVELPKALDRLLTNRWITYGGNLTFLVGAILTVVCLVQGASPTALSIALLVAGCCVMALNLGLKARTRSRHQSSPIAVQDEPPPNPAEVEPSISFGRAILPRQSQLLSLVEPDGREVRYSGRIIRVPVVNAQGAPTAPQVHARLTFLPDDRDGSFSPDEAQAEWFNESGPPEVEVDLPGNGRPRLIDVAAVLDGDYPNVYEWTGHSRAAGLIGYGVKAGSVPVLVKVLGAGRGEPSLRNTLNIDLRDGLLIADWLQRSVDEATNLVPWGGRPLNFREHSYTPDSDL